jgi:hypothetical protein
MFTINGTVLPNPEFSDQEGLRHTVDRKRAVDGTLYTYVKRRADRKLSWTFRLTKNKAFEVEALSRLWFADPVNIVDHNGRRWLGHLMNNPFEFTTTERRGQAIAPYTRGESVTVEVEFQGVEV